MVPREGFFVHPRLAAASILLLALAASVVPTAFGSGGASDVSPETAPAEFPSTQLVPELERMALAAWSEEALFHQPRMLAYAELARTYGFEPHTSRWRVSSGVTYGTPPAEWSEIAAHPVDLLTRFAAHHVEQGLGTDVWEIVTRLHLGEDFAIGAVLVWGYQDDAIAGIDYLLTMRPTDHGWRIAELHERYHCRRGVSEEDLCL